MKMTLWGKMQIKHTLYKHFVMIKKDIQIVISNLSVLLESVGRINIDK